MRTFLVATDLSERSDRAVRRAQRLARKHGGAVHVLHVVDDAMPNDIAQTVRNDAERRLHRFVGDGAGGTEAGAGSGVAVDVAADVTTVVTVVIGDPFVAIVEEARRVDADIVVFGLHRPRVFLDTLRETTVERMVRLSRRPALIVRDRADHDYARILAPVSFSPACATALKAARALAPEAEIAGVHAVYLPFSGLTHEHPGGTMDLELTAEAEATRSEWCAAQGLSEALCAVTSITGTLNEIVDQRIRDFKPHLIALGAHTRSRVAPFGLGSFAAALLRNPPADLLLAHP